MKLKEPLLFRQQAYIDGAWCNADSGATFGVDNPATGEIIGQVPDMGAAETQRAIDAANAALPAWSKLSAKARGAILRKWFDLIMANADDLAQLMVLEQGKPFAEAKGEVAYGASFVEWFAEEGKRAYGDVIPTQSLDRRFVVIKQPIGVCAAITPWNFPIAMITRKCAPGLAVGCTFVVKPAEQTPGVAWEAVQLLHAAGVPADAVQLMHGPGETVGAALVALPGIAGVAFTGSTAVARLINRALAAKDGPIVPLIAETGGLNAMVVDSTALPEQVLDAVMLSAFGSAGQRCSALRLLCMHEAIADHREVHVRDAGVHQRLGQEEEAEEAALEVVVEEARARTERLLGLEQPQVHHALRRALSARPITSG